MMEYRNLANIVCIYISGFGLRRIVLF